MKEASQVWFSAAKYILTVAETTWTSINPAAMLVPLSSVTMSVLSDMGSLTSFLIMLSHQAAEYMAPDKLHSGQCLSDGNKLDLAYSTLCTAPVCMGREAEPGSTVVCKSGAGGLFCPLQSFPPVLP